MRPYASTGVNNNRTRRLQKLGVLFLTLGYSVYPSPVLSEVIGTASLTLDFKHVPEIPFDESQLQLNVHYKATEFGAHGEHQKTVTHKSCSKLPFGGCIKSKSTVAAEKTITLKIGAGIKRIAPNKLSLQLSELLPGSGKYRLDRIHFENWSCLPVYCKPDPTYPGRRAGAGGKYSWELMFGTPSANQSPKQNMVLLGYARRQHPQCDGGP